MKTLIIEMIMDCTDYELLDLVFRILSKSSGKSNDSGNGVESLAVERV